VVTEKRSKQENADSKGSASASRKRDRPASARRASAATSTRKSSTGARRRQARVLTLQLLYEIDVTGHPATDVLDRTFAEPSAPVAIRDHVTRLVSGVLAARGEIDPFIAAAAPAFPLPQIPAIDRNVLRLAVFELLHEPAVPPKAAINEAVELAKHFGGDNSSRFVNGVLGTILDRIPSSGQGASPESPPA
jgi:N utilization substance protein B